MNCHICGIGTDFCCQICERPVCEDCCVQPTYMNQIDYALCLECNDEQETERAEELHREHMEAQKAKDKRDKINAKRRATYWKPENVEKRRLAKIERKRKKAEQNRNAMQEAVKVVGKMFRGMF